MSINTGWTPPIDRAHNIARETVRALVDLIGADPYYQWCEAQRNDDGYLPWVPRTGGICWSDLTRLAQQEIDHINSQDCDCGANGRDVCPLCVGPTAQAEELPY